MKALVGFNDLPKEISDQIDQIVRIWEHHLGDELVGVYLHGSIALNAFCPESGDIDILVVVESSISKEKKLAVAKDIIAIDGKPRPIEISAIKREDALHWINDGNCVFHYSDYWTERYRERLNDPKKELFVVDHEFPDRDVTSYIRLLTENGIRLTGSSINEIFGNISDTDFWTAISKDVEDYAFDHYNERYFASNILILGRILSFKTEKKILSKYEAGMWMIEHVPSDLKYLPEKAMKVWFEGRECDFPRGDLERLRSFLIKEIQS